MSKNTDLRQLLDGEAAERPDGWDCLGSERTLFVPYHITKDAAQALLLCKLRGLVTAKLNAMDREAAWAAYMLTVPTPELTN